MHKQQQAMMALKPTAEASKVRNREYQQLHKMVTCHHKKIEKKNPKNLAAYQAGKIALNVEMILTFESVNSEIRIPSNKFVKN